MISRIWKVYQISDMKFTIRMGVPEMEEFWNDLVCRKRSNQLNADESELFNRLAKALQHLHTNPKHPGQKTHEIEPLTRRYGMKIWQSYMDQGKQARRIYWT